MNFTRFCISTVSSVFTSRPDSRCGRVRLHSDGQRPHACARKNRDRAGISRILQRYRIARAQKSLAEQVNGLLAAVRDQELLRRTFNPFAAQHFDQHALQRLIAIGGAELAGFAGLPGAGPHCSKAGIPPRGRIHPKAAR